MTAADAPPEVTKARAAVLADRLDGNTAISSGRPPWTAGGALPLRRRRDRDRREPALGAQAIRPAPIDSVQALVACSASTGMAPVAACVISAPSLSSPPVNSSATWPSPRYRRSSVCACQSTSCGSAGQGRDARPANTPGPADACRLAGRLSGQVGGLAHLRPVTSSPQPAAASGRPHPAAPSAPERDAMAQAAWTTCRTISALRSTVATTTSAGTGPSAADRQASRSCADGHRRPRGVRAVRREVDHPGDRPATRKIRLAGGARRRSSGRRRKQPRRDRRAGRSVAHGFLLAGGIASCGALDGTRCSDDRASRRRGGGG